MILASDPELIPRVVTMLAGVGVVVAIAVVVIRMKSREHDKRQAIWRQFALENRLSLTVEPDSWLKLGEFKITGNILNLELELSTYRVQAGKATQTWVRVRTKGPGPEGNFRIETANILTRAGALLGLRRDTIDEGSFDHDFLTRSVPESLAREVFDEPLRAHFASLTRKPRLTYANDVCELTWQCGDESLGQLTDAVQLHAMLRGAFARMGRRSN